MSKITGKDRRPSSLVYNGFMDIAAPAITVTANQSPTAIQSSVPLALNCKLIAVAISMSGTVAGTVFANVLSGPEPYNTQAQAYNQGTIAGNYPEDYTVQPGQYIFPNPEAVTMTAGAVTVIYNSAETDVVLPAGSLLSLVFASNGTASGNMNVHFLVSPVDQHPMSPEQYAEPFVVGPTTI